jgi:hypothetical protein
MSSNTLPTEIIEKIIIHTGDFILAIKLGLRYPIKKLYNKYIHTIRWAIKTKDLIVIKWIYSNKINSDNDMNLLDYACQVNSMKVLIWLHENTEQTSTTYAMDYSCFHGNLRMLVWLNNNTNAGLTSYSMEHATKNGYFHIMKWLKRNTKIGITSETMNYACKKGNLKMVQWINKHASSKTSKKNAMGIAAEFGHLKLVKWLHLNKKENISRFQDVSEDQTALKMDLFYRAKTSKKYAMYMANLSGHLDICCWLNEN